MVIEIALGIVLAVIVLCFLPLILIILVYALALAVLVACLSLLGWGAYELYQHFILELALVSYYSIFA